MPNQFSLTLPDFRNLGVLLRAALIAQLFGASAALVKTDGLLPAVSEFISMAGVLEPPLLLALLVLFLISPWLHRRAVWSGVGVVLLVVLGSSLLWHAVLLSRYASIGQGSVLRTLLLALATGVILLVYFDWRHRILSPALAEARLQALQARIRPHFLFNSLNTILAMLRSSPQQAEALLHDLADLFRVHMADNRQLSPLSRELELAHAYAQLEQARLGDRLQVEWQVEHAPGDALVPPLILQPLLENAVYHGIEPNPDGGVVRVDAFSKGGQLYLVTRNPCLAGAEPRPGNRMALSNIQERLALHFDAEGRLTTHRAGGEFIVQLVMPLRPAGGGA